MFLLKMFVDHMSFILLSEDILINFFRFLLVFTINEKYEYDDSPSQLDIIETNPFKNITHLSLTFIAASKPAVKQYIASGFRSLKVCTVPIIFLNYAF